MLEIYGKLTYIHGFENFIQSLNHLTTGLHLTKLLYSLSKENINFSIIEGYNLAKDTYKDFDTCLIEIPTKKDIEQVLDLINDEYIKVIDDNKILIQV